MSRRPPQLPAEVWILIFAHLSASDKFRIRESCKYFKSLVDHASLWKGWAVVLWFRRCTYNSVFWSSLRRRKVSSAVVRNTTANNLQRLSQALPGLSTVVVELSNQTSLTRLKDFPELKRVVVRNRGYVASVLSDFIPACQCQQLTHLSLCGVKFPVVMSVDAVIATLSQCTKLTSLICHHMLLERETFSIIHSIIMQMPKLKHLSVSVSPAYCDLRRYPGSTFHSEWTCKQATTSALSSLELVDCGNITYPPNAVTLMPGLSSLAVFYKKTYEGILAQRSFEGWRLTTWLHNFPKLSKLVVVRGPPVKTYTASIPATVTSLTLCVSELNPEDLAAIAVQVPNLLHMHVDPRPLRQRTNTVDIPQLFPKLKSLAIRHYGPEEDFLSLHKLQSLERLEILDSGPCLSELINKLCALTRHRLRITLSPRSEDKLSCPCVVLF